MRWFHDILEVNRFYLIRDLRNVLHLQWYWIYCVARRKRDTTTSTFSRKFLVFLTLYHFEPVSIIVLYESLICIHVLFLLATKSLSGEYNWTIGSLLGQKWYIQKALNYIIICKVWYQVVVIWGCHLLKMILLGGRFTGFLVKRFWYWAILLYFSIKGQFNVKIESK